MVKVLYVIFCCNKAPVMQIRFVAPPDSRSAVVSYWQKYVHEVLVNPLGGLNLPRKSVVRLTDCPNMTIDVYCAHKTTTQHNKQIQVPKFTTKIYKKCYTKKIKKYYKTFCPITVLKALRLLHNNAPIHKSDLHKFWSQRRSPSYHILRFCQTLPP